MLLEYKFKNFGTFKDEVIFSMIPGKSSKRFEDNFVSFKDKLKISKISVIAGENAGGKSTFIRSLEYFRSLIVKDRDRAFNLENTDSQFFEISVLIKESIYVYNLVLNKFGIESEELQIRNMTQKSEKNELIFSATRDYKSSEKEILVNLKMSGKYFSKEYFKLLQEKLSLPLNGLHLNALSLLGLEEAKIFKEFIENKLVLKLPEDVSLNLEKDFEENKNDVEVLNDDKFLEIFSLVDSTIKGVKINSDKPFRESIIIRECENKRTEIEIREDSSGVREFFAWAINIWEVIYKDKILFADEIDKVLNSILSTKVVNFIKASKQQGQFIFTTHNVLHLNTNTFMKEQIHFISKNAETLESEMYSLADFKDYKYDNPRVYELYLKGLLGAVPNE